MKNKCSVCGQDNPKDNFICDNPDCGVPLDLRIERNEFGLPEIISTNKF